MNRTRSITTPTSLGGKVCPDLSMTTGCNTHGCHNAVCHEKHVTCRLEYVHYGRHRGGSGGTSGAVVPVSATADTRQGATSSSICHYGSTPNRNNAADQTNPSSMSKAEWDKCHYCDTAYECNMKHITRTISVMHDKRYMHIKSQFHCKIVSTAPLDPTKMFQVETAHFKMGRRVRNKHLLVSAQKKCECTCTAHPTACFRTGFRFAGSEIDGNDYQGIEHINACSNLCTHHPECKAWEYDSTKRCILKSGTPTYEQNLDTTMTTYAGLSSGVSGCVTNITHQGVYEGFGSNLNAVSSPAPTPVPATERETHAQYSSSRGGTYTGNTFAHLVGVEHLTANEEGNLRVTSHMTATSAAAAL